MADSIFAAASTTGVGSSERIAGEFMAQGRPDNPSNVMEGECLGGFDIKTPRVGTGFIEWAIEGYNLEGRAPEAVTETNYNKRGDWAYDKKVLPFVAQPHEDDDSYHDGDKHTKKGSH